MDFYNLIRNLDIEQINELISLRIDQEKYKSLQMRKRFIGIDCDINPKISLTGEEDLDSQCIWSGFIPEDVKIIYSFLPNEDGYTVNNGCYYYIDDHEYLYQFAHYIKTKEIKTEIEFLSYVYRFIDYYFNSLDTEFTHRMFMHQPLIDSNGRYIKPTMGHRFIDFKSSNNAECSEYSAMAQNILSIFNYPTLYFGGSVKTIHGTGGHAFNFTLVNSSPCIIDFTIPVKIYSINGEYKGESPFLGPIEDFTADTFERHTQERVPYNFKEYYYLDTLKDLLMISEGNTRHYVIGSVDYFNNEHTLQKKNK